MPLNTGTLDISSLLDVTFQSVAEYGLSNIEEILRDDLEAHNAIAEDMVGNLCEISTDRQRKYGASVEGEMVEVDEYGQAPTQRNAVGSTVGFPLRKFQYNLGWTSEWFKRHTPADMAKAVIGAQKAHLKRLQTDIKKAIFLSSNYTFTDHLVDNVDLAVKRLVNADSMAIPNGPNGETFTASTHTHYNANATLTTTVATELIDDVVEHGHGSMVRVAINRANEAAWKALTGFQAYVDPRIVYRASDTPGQTLDITRLDNRAIGLFGAAEVWVKPWVPANYSFAWDAGDPNKPLVFRQDMPEDFRGLRVAASLESHPLYAEFMEAYFGIAVWTRTNGAVLQFNNATYQDPSL